MSTDLEALKPVFDAALDAVVIIDASGLVRAWNRAAEETFGRSREEALGQPMADLIVPGHLRDAHRAGLERFLGTGEARILGKRIEVEGCDRSGREFPVELTITHVEMGGERLFVGYLRDISERREAESQLRASESRLSEERARLTTLIESLPVGVCFIDPAGKAILSNPAYRRYVPESVLPSATPDAEGRWVGFDEDGRRLTRDRFVGVRALRGETIEGIEFLYDGRVWTRISGVPLRNEADEVIAAIVVVMDIDDLKRAQRELEHLNRTLEQRVAIEVAERAKTEEALRQSQKMEAMGQLTGGVAHDFNNLLTPIIGGLDLLHRRDSNDERSQRLIAGALASADRARVLVQRLLAFARRQPLQPQPTDVLDVVTGMADLIGGTTGPRIRVAVEAEPGLPYAMAETNQLEMAILNLAVNARDAMPEGGSLHLSIRAETLAAPRAGVSAGRYVVLSVADTGAGMDEATLSRAIDPFFSTKGVGKGTGLGLSMVHGLAAQLGGGLVLHSTVGMGTNIELWLPVAEGGDSPRQASTGQGAALPSGVVLLVDDEDLVRASTTEILSDLGFEVVEAASAERALELVRRGLVFDLIITDHLMPGMTGSELASVVRQEQPKTPVLIVSGYAELEGLAPDLPRLTKPFLQRELREAISTAMRGVRARA